MSVVFMFADGACRGNPGKGAYGVVFKDAEGRELHTLSKAIGQTTNNLAEYAGLLGGLEYAVDSKMKDLVVYLDSELIVKQMNSIYKVRHPKLIPCYQKALKLSRQFSSFSIEHIPRSKNTIADALANEALDLL